MNKSIFLTIFLSVFIFSNAFSQAKRTIPMVLEFNTNLSSGTTIGLPLTGTDLRVDWGDGNIDNINAASVTTTEHTYINEGTYNCKYNRDINKIW